MMTAINHWFFLFLLFVAYQLFTRPLLPFLQVFIESRWGGWTIGGNKGGSATSFPLVFLKGST
jgi:hypothetical protein